MTHTLAAVFDNRADANGAREALIDAGFDVASIQLSDSATVAGAGQQFDAIVSSNEAGDAIADKIKHFFSRCFDTDYREHRIYSEAIERGCVVLTIQAVSREQARNAAVIVDTFGPLDINQQQARWGAGEWAGIKMEQGSVPNPQPDVGLQQRSQQQRDMLQTAQRGAQEMVQSTQSESSASRQGMQEAGAMQRAVSEAELPHDAASRLDNSRRLPPTPNQGSLNIQRGDSLGISEDTYFRAHWLDTFSYMGGTYQEYDPAYRYGASMANRATYQGSAWEDAEPELRESWERDYPASRWDKVKEAVRAGWVRMTK
ncbi:hypothetical protein H3H36_24450 [Duganella sp. FT3S]|uniref:Uncharacterized protein n=1 Tax=Rugamonas fusca TaxID=2758568 RepID=A0A7W2EMB1_9BURK|nr:hypothetical protein [Rugamonas fusca]MBA5608502.1 hypothetical protein [Rugamonas fusca]